MKQSKKRDHVAKIEKDSLQKSLNDFFGKGKTKKSENPMRLKDIDEAIAQAVCPLKKDV